MKIFIVHARRTGYGVIRSLYKEAKKNIYIADTTKTPIFKSRLIKKSFIISDITRVSENDFLQEMIKLAKDMNYKKEKPIIYTGKDDYLIFFCKNYEILKEYFLYSFETDFSKLNRALSKLELIKVAINANVLIPKSFTNNDSLDLIVSESNFPVIVKPAVKNKPEIDVVQVAFRIKKCMNIYELKQAIGSLSVIGIEYIVQEYIEGGDEELFTIGTYSYKGKLLAWSTSKKIRQFPPNTGECSFGKTIYNDALLEPAEKLLKEIGLTGISQIEFKKFEGQYYLIEINPRVWSWHQIHEKVGVNLCLIAATNVHGNLPSTVCKPFNGKNASKTWMFLSMDYLHNCLLNNNVSKYKILRDFLRCDIEAFFIWHDLFTFIEHFKTTYSYIKQVLLVNKD